MEAEKIDMGFYLPIVFKYPEFEKVRDIQGRVESAATKFNVKLSSAVIDARRDPLSASKL